MERLMGPCWRSIMREGSSYAQSSAAGGLEGPACPSAEESIGMC